MSNQLSQVTTWLEQSRPSFEEMNLNKLDFAREKEFMIQKFQENPYLLTMNPDTIRNVLVNCALIGITLNPSLKLAYPVPRKGRLCLDVSYMGLIKIVTDTGSVKSIDAAVVYSNEHFDIELGSNPYVKHKPNLTSPDKGQKLGAYSVAILNDGSCHVHWMYAKDIEAIKARSESVKAKKQSPWDSDPDEMWKKTVVKQHWKYLPKSERAEMAANAIAAENDANGIDFEKERQQAQNKTIAIDMLDNSIEENVKKFTELIELAKDGTIPNVFKTKTGEYNMANTIESMENDFAENALHLEKFTKMDKFIRDTYAFFAKKKDDGNA